MRRALALSLAAASVVAATALADDPIAYDGLNGTVGAVHAQTTGTNFGAWQSQNNSLDTYKIGGNLSYPYLSTSGGGLYGGGKYESAGVGLNTAAFGPLGSGGSVGVDGNTLWASAVVNNISGSSSFTLSFHDDSTRWAEGSNAIEINSSGGYWNIAQKGGASVSTGIRVDPSKTTLMVAKFEFNSTSSDRVTLYVDPTPGQAAPSTAGTVLTTTSNVRFRSVGFYPGSGYINGAMDEVRFGQSFSAVTPYDATATPQTAGKRVRAYMIGNSLTDNINSEALRLTAMNRGQFMPWARQVNLGSPLDNIVANPTSGFLTAPYNGWNNALPNYKWDVVSMEPFDRQLASDKASCKTLIDSALSNPANHDTQFLIYSRWPRRPDGTNIDFQALWDRPYTGAYGTEETRDYFQQVVTELRAMYPTMEKPINLVPVGDVLYELDKRMKHGDIPGWADINQVYLDGIHMNATGEYIVGMTYYATMFQESPVGLPYSDYGLTDPVLAAAIQDAAWDVVSTHPYAGVSVPEPASIGVVLGSALMLLARRRK